MVECPTREALLFLFPKLNSFAQFESSINSLFVYNKDMSEQSIITPTEEKDETELEFESVTSQIEKKYSKEFVKVLKRLVNEIAVVGMDEREACLLVNFEYEKLISMKQSDELIRRLFEMKSLEYKRGMMKTLSDKARKGDDKLAQWLLESKFPDEFNRRKGAGGSGREGEDLLGAAVEFIQKSTAPSGIVSETAGRAFLVKGNQQKKAPMNIHDTLAGRAAKIAEEVKQEETV